MGFSTVKSAFTKTFGIMKIGSHAIPGIGRGLSAPFRPMKTLHGIRSTGMAITDAARAGNLAEAGKQSMKLLGTASGLTYGYRLAKGKSAFKDSAGKKDRVPWVPWL